MAFYSDSFVYNQQLSESYNLRIASSDSNGGVSSNPGSGTIKIFEDFVYKRPVPFFYGVQYDTKLQFPIVIFSPDEITAIDATYVQNWLFGQLSYKKLVVCQPDMDNIYFNCVITDPVVIRDGNVIRGFSGTCICDSPFVWTYPKTNIYSGSTSFSFNNDSHYPGYLKPQIQFTMNAYGGTCNILNATDNNRLFSFTNLNPYEVITVNNDLGIVTSSIGSRRLSNFNKNFFQLVQGINNITISGNASTVLLTYQFARRLGG